MAHGFSLGGVESLRPSGLNRCLPIIREQFKSLESTAHHHSTPPPLKTVGHPYPVTKPGRLPICSNLPADITISPMSLIVQKFGGTSVATAEKIHRAARRAIQERLNGQQVVMVVSAMGKTTDELLTLARAVSPNPPKRELDMLLTTGEQVSIALMAMAIHGFGHEAISLTAGQLGLRTDSVHTRARIQSIDRQRLKAELDAGKVVIVAGFQGIDQAGEITTLGRGASDTTAAALAAVLGATVCEIYTDVDGVYTADPRIVPNARKIDAISYDEMLEMASAGAGVMHGRAIEFGMRFNVPIHVRSSLTDAPGTRIMTESEGMEAVSVRGVTLKEDLASIVVTDVPAQTGVPARVFEEIGKKNIVVDDIVQANHAGGQRASLALLVDSEDADTATELLQRLAGELGIGKVEVFRDLSKVSAIGVGMRSHSGVASTMFDALRSATIPIWGISTSEIVISCVVAAGDGPNGVRAVHDAFDLSAHDDNGTDA